MLEHSTAAFQAWESITIVIKTENELMPTRPIISAKTKTALQRCVLGNY